jgi:putative endonuclease
MESGKHDRRSIGQKGEDIACSLLEEKGHTILERNWRYGHLEIDIISADPVGIHFVEVKSRCHSVQAPPQDNVDRTKQRRIAKAAQAYLRTSRGLPLKNMECLFDVVAVTFDGRSAYTEYLEQAYMPLYI